MEKEFNDVVKGKAPRSVLEQAHDKFTRIALTALDRAHPQSYTNCCHSFTADNIKANINNLGDKDKVVLLGGSDTVAHSILVSKDGEILADSEFNQQGIDVQLDMDAGLYRVEMEPGSGKYINLNVVQSVDFADFKQYYLDGVEARMYKNKPDADVLGSDV